jgi:hypothetical protein
MACKRIANRDLDYDHPLSQQTPENQSADIDPREALFIDHLERRRNGLEQAMWQAPALTIAA